MPAHKTDTGRTGVWLVGARGSVATTTVVGALAIRAGLAGTGGMVTELEPFAEAGLPGVDELVFGGHDVAEVPWGRRPRPWRRPGAPGPPGPGPGRGPRRGGA
ncbi:hypothetical protein O1L68_41290 [Streptomyces lydicus]|nr:hypothetical protein [Streptomyces lydicus]